MADRGSYGLGPRLDIQQLFLEAQHRWLRPAEICEILRNYQKFHISSEPPSRPPSRIAESLNLMNLLIELLLYQKYEGFQRLYNHYY